VSGSGDVQPTRALTIIFYYNKVIVEQGSIDTVCGDKSNTAHASNEICHRVGSMIVE